MEERLLLSYAEEIEDPSTGWERVRGLWVAICEKNVRPELVEAAIGIIHNEAMERLLLKRPSDDRSYPDIWCFPGGRRDPIQRAGRGTEKEPLVRTVTRETFEETGLQTSVKRKIGVRRAVHPDRNRLYVIHSYLLGVQGDPNAVRLSNEHVEYGYFPRGSAPEKMGTVTRAMFDWEPGN